MTASDTVLARSEVIRQRIMDLEAFMTAEVYQVWLRSRQAEIQIFNDDVALSAQSWEEVIKLRAMRDNTTLLQTSFEELRDSLKTELTDAVESETNIASTRKV